MMQVSVRELKNHLSEYLHRVEQGEDIQVARRNVPVARLTPIPRIALTRMPGTSWSGIKAKGGRSRPVISGKGTADRVLEEAHARKVLQGMKAAAASGSHKVAYVDARAAFARLQRE